MPKSWMALPTRPRRCATPFRTATTILRSVVAASSRNSCRIASASASSPGRLSSADGSTTTSSSESVANPPSTWASPRAILALTERRFLWLLDDAPVARVRSVPLRDVAGVEHRTRRKRATLTVRTLTGRRHAFHELRPHTALSIERYLARDRPA